MSKIEIPTFPEHWTTNVVVNWINSREEPINILLEAVEAEIEEAESLLVNIRNEFERTKCDKSNLEECDRSCTELHECLKMVVDAHAKEQFANEFDAIAIYDKADRRAADLVKILMARKLWKENVIIIENLDVNEPAPENVVINLQKAYESLSEFLSVPERADFLERIKDVFLSWYSTRIVLAIQSETPVDDLLPVKQKYEMLRRIQDFNNVVRHYLEGENKFTFHAANNLSDLFLDTRGVIISSYKRLMDGWVEKVLDTPDVFLSNTFEEVILMRENEIKDACIGTIGKTLEDDVSGSQTLKMILEFRSVMSQYVLRPDDDKSIAKCITQFGELLLFSTTSEYTKLATSFLANCSNISLDSTLTFACLEQLSSRLSELILESNYLIQIAKETFGNIAIIFLTPAFRTMYENVVSMLDKFYKMHMNKNTVKDEDVLRMVSISGQLLTWIDNDKQQLKDMFEHLGVVDTDPTIGRLSVKLFSEISNFQSKLSAKGECDINLAKARAEVRKMNKRFIARTVEVLSRTLIADMESGLGNLISDKNSENIKVQESTKVPSFGTSPNEFVTAAGVALLSLAHQLSAYSQDSNMASAIMFATKLETVGKPLEEIKMNEMKLYIDDIPSWWVGKCAVAVQECFVDTVGDIAEYSSCLCRQLSVDYTYLADVFEDLGTTKIPDFVNMRQMFLNVGCLES
uniref:Conserved oligomeric Golgi complex subunit 7 n=1 Tax=Brugia malayi TaxID=6279 RepID=A0A0H5S3P8_BRUMA|nr:Bm9068 [Brugia malayi]